MFGLLLSSGLCCLMGLSNISGSRNRINYNCFLGVTLDFRDEISCPFCFLLQLGEFHMLLKHSGGLIILRLPKWRLFLVVRLRLVVVVGGGACAIVGALGTCACGARGPLLPSQGCCAGKKRCKCIHANNRGSRSHELRVAK
jgi:hypothetical protein